MLHLMNYFLLLLRKNIEKDWELFHYLNLRLNEMFDCESFLVWMHDTGVLRMNDVRERQVMLQLLHYLQGALQDLQTQINCVQRLCVLGFHEGN